MCDVIPIRPTVGISRIEQLRAFVEWEKSVTPEKTHIAVWALHEIERLRDSIQQTLDENGHLADGDNCTLIHLVRAMETPNVELTGSALLRSPVERRVRVFYVYRGIDLLDVTKF